MRAQTKSEDKEVTHPAVLQTWDFNISLPNFWHDYVYLVQNI